MDRHSSNDIIKRLTKETVGNYNTGRRKMEERTGYSHFRRRKEIQNESNEQIGTEIRTVRDSESHVLYRDPVCGGRTGPDDGTGILHPVPDAGCEGDPSRTDLASRYIYDLAAVWQSFLQPDSDLPLLQSGNDSGAGLGNLPV